MIRAFFLLIGVGALGAVGWYGAVQPLPEPFDAYTGYAARIEAQLQQAVDEALAETELDWASARVEGQIATLEGEAPREDERGEARAAVQVAAGPGGVWNGGIVRVDDETTLAPPIAPYEWSVTRDGDRATLTGAVPSRAARADLVAFARELFPGGIDDEMTIGRGAPGGDEATWANVARAAIEQVARLTTGEATLRDERLSIVGDAGDARARERVTSELFRLPPPYVAIARVEAPDEVGAEEAAAEEEAVDRSPIEGREACQEAFDAAAAEADPVGFGEEDAVIENESYALLDALSILALRCQRVSVVVLGAAVEEGVDDALALARAQAVADYFVLQRMPPQRVSAELVQAQDDGEDEADNGQETGDEAESIPPAIAFEIRD